MRFVTNEGKPVTIDDASLRTGGANLANLRIKDVDMTFSDLNGADLSNSLLENVNLEKVSMQDANLTRTSFIECNMIGVQFNGAKFGPTSFHGSRLTGADIGKAGFVSQDTRNAEIFQYADISDADFRYVLNPTKDEILQFVNYGRWLEVPQLPIGVTVPASNHNLEQAKWQKSDFQGKTIENANMRQIVLDESNLNSVHLTQIDLASASLKNVLMNDAKLLGIDFTKATLEGSEASGSTFDDVRGFCKSRCFLC